MRQFLNFKASIYAYLNVPIISGLFLALSACKPAAQSPNQTPPQSYLQTQNLPPLATLLACLPDEAAITAAHRGTSKNWDAPENSLTGLKILIEKTYMMAEIDVAGLRDGTLITFHNGVWDETSTGRGAVASSRKSDLNQILLRSPKGPLSAERPPELGDMLALAKDRLYLEIDFKSSAPYEDVLRAIRHANMQDQVILIAYSNGQAKKLARLAPDMLRSTPLSEAKSGQLVWLGKSAKDERAAQAVHDKGAYIIAKLGADQNVRESGYEDNKKIIERAQIVVSDHIDQFEPIMGLKNLNVTDRVAFEDCLQKHHKGKL